MKKLKVFGVSWHIAHNVALSNLPFVGEYHLCRTPFKKWDAAGRPIPDNVKFVTEYDPDEKYDLAILHFDQQVVEPRISKGRVLKEMITKIDCPLVVINHQTPFSDRMTTGELIKETRRLLKDTPMICNSKKAVQQWGWGHVIIHGLETNVGSHPSCDWYDLPKEPRSITVLTKAGMEKAYQRKFLHATRERLVDEGVPFVWIGLDRGRFPSFDEYKEYLGRSLVFLNGTVNSPMPRSRTEAMLSGCCIVTLVHHGIDEYIENGVNGFIIPRNPESAVKLIKELLTTRYDEAVEIGKRGQKTAIERLNGKNFAKQWIEFLNEVYPEIL